MPTKPLLSTSEAQGGLCFRGFLSSALLASALLAANASASIFDAPELNAPKASTEPELPGIKPTSPLSNYKLGAGDIVTIRVFGEDELSRERVKLTDAGTLQYPVLGEIVIKDMTTGDLQRLITTGLKGRYLVNPRVAVFIEEYRPYYINGMIASAGGYPFQPGLTVLKAIALAGGFKERASKEKIFVIRANDPSQVQQKVDLNTLIFPGDIITVQDSFF
ncbi:polysaccharide biosynthesis/export family protein [Iodobacter fluviatilis]|uniref:Polysaccharide export outer membrane protein n=1 Tax=Iodobacter fluviatilis TaxID=537 RepID=A0A377Q3T2_9NEIS|nr:polysaccharide biosynthesis/export family protein [Iodobacter fluviatilis]TCU81494.1 polysaccharide export outer membrane protein [Iodobacter fluviatilis]STQ89936.1 polysaccharide export protein Wza [Iodobacter fluviatilis]